MLINGVYYCDGCRRSVPTIEAKAAILQYGPTADLLCSRCQRGEGLGPASADGEGGEGDWRETFSRSRPSLGERESRRPSRASRRERGRDAYYGGGAGARGDYDDYDDYDDEYERPRRPPPRGPGAFSKTTMGAGLLLLLLGFFFAIFGYMKSLDSVKGEEKKLKEEARDLRAEARKKEGEESEKLLRKAAALKKEAAELNASQRSAAAVKPLPLLGGGLMLGGVIVMVVGAMGGASTAAKSRGRYGRRR